MAGTVASFAALVALCVAFCGIKGVPGGAAPLLAISTIMVYFSLAGVLGVLLPAGWLFYLVCAAGAALALARQRGRAMAKLRHPGLWLFWLFALVLLVYFALRQPAFFGWDNFSGMGTAVKRTVLDGRLYPEGELGFFWPLTERPALVVLGWFFQFWGGGFAAWRVMWAYDLLYLACAAALCAPFGNSVKTCLPLWVAGILLPHFVTVPAATISLVPTWMSAYADVPAGMLFGGVLALYFGARFSGRAAAVWPAALPLCALALAKDNVVPVALVAAGVLAADTLLFARGRTEGTAPAASLGGAGSEQLKANTASQSPGAKALLRGAGVAAGWFLAVLAAYFLWTNYIPRAVAQSTSGQTNISPLQAAAQAAQQLFGLVPKSDNYLAVSQGLWDRFLGRGGARITMAGSAFVTVLFCAGLFLVAVLLWRGAKPRLRIALCGGLLALGLLAYHFMLLASYAFLSHQKEDFIIFDYDRYLSSYLPGLLMLGILLLALAAQRGGLHSPAAQHADIQPRGGWRKPAAQLLVLCVAVGGLWQCGRLLRPGYSVLDYSDSFMQETRTRQQVAKEMADAAGFATGTRIFYVCQGGDGGQYFEYHHYLLPYVLDYSITGGGSFAEDIKETAPEAVEKYLDEQGIEYLFVDRMDEEFAAEYARLFAGPLQQSYSAPALYRRGQDGKYQLLWQQESEKTDA